MWQRAKIKISRSSPEVVGLLIWTQGEPYEDTYFSIPAWPNLVTNRVYDTNLIDDTHDVLRPVVIPFESVELRGEFQERVDKQTITEWKADANNKETESQEQL